MLETLDTLFPETDPYLQVGGNETVGQGWFAVRVRRGDAGGGGVKTIEQERAADALARVAELSGRSAGFKKSYRAYVDRMGPAIVMNGLGQALATELAAAGPKPEKDDQKAHRALYQSLQRWLCRAAGGVYPSGDDVLQAIVVGDESCYLHAQAEALAWLGWHKKCCRAAFPKSEEDPA